MESSSCESIVTRVLVFVLVAVPGAAGLVLGTVLYLRPDLAGVRAVLAIIAGSSILVLIGVGKLRQPLYLLVILSIPVGFAVSSALFGLRWGSPGIIVGVLGGVTLVIVRNIYRNRHRRAS